MTQKRGISIIELFRRFESLMTYFMEKLQECAATNTRMSKSEKDKQDLTIFSILLLTSRLVPYSFFDGDEDPCAQHRELFERDENMRNRLAAFIALIKNYSASSTYFVRKISAQAMLPLIAFADFIPQTVRTLQELCEAGTSLR